MSPAAAVRSRAAAAFIHAGAPAGDPVRTPGVSGISSGISAFRFSRRSSGGAAVGDSDSIFSTSIFLNRFME
jgi:hypothetical protein